MKFLPVEHYGGNDYGRVSNDEIESFSKKVAKDLNKEWALLTETGRHGMSISGSLFTVQHRNFAEYFSRLQHR